MQINEEEMRLDEEVEMRLDEDKDNDQMMKGLESDADEVYNEDKQPTAMRIGMQQIIHSGYISIAPLQVHYYSEALPTEHGYCVGVSRRRVTDNCE